MSALRDMARASRASRRGRPGEDSIPAGWVGRVYRVREETNDAGVEAGLYITVPRLTKDEVHGPVPHLHSAGPLAEGDSVLVIALEGRIESLLVVGRISWGPPSP